MATQVRRLYHLLCGFEIIPKTVSTKDSGARFVMAEPISAFLMDTAAGWMLFDCGINTENIDDPVRRKKYYEDAGWTPPPVVYPQHDLLLQLEEIGVAPSDVSLVMISHVHADHTGNLRHFRHAKIGIQRREHEHAMRAGPEDAVHPVDYDFDDMKWDLHDGDWSPVEGIEVLDTRGHTPGHQSMIVTLPNTGALVMPADAGDLLENFQRRILPGETVDDAAARSAQERLLEAVEERDAQFRFTHDPVQIQKVKLAPEFYD